MLAQFPAFLRVKSSLLSAIFACALGLVFTQEASAQGRPTVVPFTPTPTATPVPPPQSPATSSGPVVIDFSFDGADTTVTYTSPTGALAGLTFSANFGSGSGSDQFTSSSLFRTAGSGGYARWTFGGASSPTWGTGTAGNVFASSVTGDVFGIVSNGFLVPVGYNLFTGATLTGSLRFDGLSLIDLGFLLNDPASGSFAVAGTNVSWTTTVVPEPGSAALFAALAALTLVASNRPRRAAVPASLT